MNPYLQQILHDITTRLAALEQRTWVGLDEEEHDEIIKQCAALDSRYVAAIVEAKLKEKNG